MRACNICRDLYWPTGRDVLGVCDGCRPNLLALEQLSAREVVEETIVQQLLREQRMDEEERHGP